jgi:hypothetical protein
MEFDGKNLKFEINSPATHLALSEPVFGDSRRDLWRQTGRLVEIDAFSSRHIGKLITRTFAELNPAVYVLDSLPNMSAAVVTERVEPFVKVLRKAHPATPILFAEDRSYTDSFLIAAKRQRNTDSRTAFRAAIERLTSAGTNQLAYLDGEEMLGDDGEGTVDSSHPTDPGFVRQADAFEKALVPLLPK